MKKCFTWCGAISLFAMTAFADTDAIVKRMHEQQLIISGQRQGSAELARRELKDLMRQFAKEEGKTQLGKALDWLNDRGGDLGVETDVTSLYDGFNRYAGRDSVVPLEMSLVQSAAVVEKVSGAYNTLKDYKDDAKRGYSYAKRLYELSGVFEENQEPAAKRLSSNLSLLADAMSNYGDKVPLIGMFISAYGDVAGEMIKAVDRLGEKLNARNPWLNDATYGSNELTRAYRNQMGGVWMKPVLGLRDCYFTDDGSQRVYIFDLKSRHRDRVSGVEFDGAFVPVSQYPPFDGMSVNATIRELRRRYMMFDRAGVKTPGVRQVLREADRIIRLEPQLDHAAIEAGQGFPVQVLAYYAVDGRPVPRSAGPELSLSQDTGYWGTETRSAKLAQFITWKAPSSEGSYELLVDLSEASKKEGWRLVDDKSAKAPYIVGAPTRLSLQSARNSIATTRRQPVQISVELTDGSGGALSAGDLSLEVKPRGQFGLEVPNSYLDPQSTIEISGSELSPSMTINLVPLDTAVLTPGIVHLSATYKDGTKRIASNTIPFRIQEPEVIDASRINVKTRPRSDGLDFALTVSDRENRKIRIGTVTITALTDGLFRTARGSEPSTVVDLSRPGPLAWVRGKRARTPLHFRLEFSGGAWGDALYSPVTTDWTLAEDAPSVEVPLFVGGAVPIDPPPAEPIPNDPQEAVALGAAVVVTASEWSAIETAALPESTTSTPSTELTEGNLFAGIGIPNAPPVATRSEIPPAGDLFAGVGDGLGVTGENFPPPPPPSGGLFAGVDQAIANSTPPSSGATTSAYNPNRRELRILGVKVTNDSGVAMEFTPGQAASVELSTKWEGMFLDRSRLIIQIDDQTVFDEIHEFRDRTGTYKTDFRQVIQIPANIRPGDHQLTVSFSPIPNSRMLLDCGPRSVSIVVKGTEAAEARSPSTVPIAASGAVAQFAAQYDLPDALLRTPDFAEALAEVLEIYRTKPADQRRRLSEGSSSRHQWSISLDFENNDPRGRLQMINVRARNGPQAYNFSNVSTYYKTMGTIGTEWVRTRESFIDPSGSGSWLRFERNPNGNKEESCDGSGPHASLMRIWHQDSTQLYREVHYDTRTGEETLVQIWGLKGKLSFKKIGKGAGNWESWRYCTQCGAISQHTIFENGREARQPVQVCTHVAEEQRRMKELF